MRRAFRISTENHSGSVKIRRLICLGLILLPALAIQAVEDPVKTEESRSAGMETITGELELKLEDWMINLSAFHSEAEEESMSCETWMTRIHENSWIGITEEEHTPEIEDWMLQPKTWRPDSAPTSCKSR